MLFCSQKGAMIKRLPNLQNFRFCCLMWPVPLPFERRSKYYRNQKWIRTRGGPFFFFIFIRLLCQLTQQKPPLRTLEAGHPLSRPMRRACAWLRGRGHTRFFVLGSRAMIFSKAPGGDAFVQLLSQRWPIYGQTGQFTGFCVCGICVLYNRPSERFLFYVSKTSAG